VVGGLLSGWLVAVQQNPPVKVASPGPTPVEIRVLHVNWTATGCFVRNQSTNGGSVGAAAPFTEAVTLLNEDTTKPCTLSSAMVSPAAFQLENGNLPVVIPPSGSANVTVSILAPTYSPPVGLSIALAAGG